MEDTHTGARVERVKSLVSLYTVHSLLTVESWATCVCIAKLDLLTVVHTNELFLHMFFLVYFEKLHAFVRFLKCTFHMHFGPSTSELYCTLQCHPWIKHRGHKKKRKWSPTEDCLTNSPCQHLIKNREQFGEYTYWW